MRLVVAILASATLGTFAATACGTGRTPIEAHPDREPVPLTTGSLSRASDWREDLARIEVAVRRTLPEIENLTDPAE